MSLLTLKDIGKIYVSEGTVSVGIRGVNLIFDRGEFVAITGQSGSGKSTLLNVISGMDSYEEGELFVEGNPTSHYTQADWEKYREKYISFIFQEYNIIDSFTVLQNVELSLMHIQNPIERRNKAMELIRRVGLEQHINHKGSHLSGGQKQRTVIARALAKDSPIILADEPTGNLDSATSAEITELLKEVSKDKLLIVVTHNFEDFEKYATREIRIFDGAVASDNIMGTANVSETDETKEETLELQKHSTARNSIKLGTAIFKSMPKLSIFMSILVAVAAAAIMFTFASFWANIRVFFINSNYLFTDNDGRAVIVRQDGAPITDEELEELAEKTGADSYKHFDYMFDEKTIKEWREFFASYEYTQIGSEPLKVTYIGDYGTLDLGRYPEADDEIVLRIPYFMRERYGKDTIEVDTYTRAGKNNTYYYEDPIQKLSYRVVGISYYLDSDVQGEILLTEAGYDRMAAFAYLGNKYIVASQLTDGEETDSSRYIRFDSSLPVGEVRFNPQKRLPDNEAKITNITEAYFKLNGIQGDETKSFNLISSVDKISIDNSYPTEGALYMHPDTLYNAIKELVSENYRQASLFFGSENKAKSAADKLNDMGYIVATNNARYVVADNMEMIEYILLGVFYLVMWVFIIIFIAFLIRICTQKSMDAFKSDIAIMRSMGIRVREIRNAVYIRIFMCAIPAIIGMPILANYLYHTDFGGRNLMYLHLSEYVMIYFLLLLVVLRVTKKHVKNLFNENVRKALKGDNT